MKNFLILFTFLSSTALAANPGTNTRDQQKEKDRAHITKADQSTVGAEEAGSKKDNVQRNKSMKKTNNQDANFKSQQKEGETDPRDDSANR